MAEGKRIEHLSNSQLNELAECLYAYKLKRIDRVSIPERPAWWNIGGNAVHGLCQRWEEWFAGLQVVRLQGAHSNRSGGSPVEEAGTDLRVVLGPVGPVPGETARTVDGFDWGGGWDEQFQFFIAEQLDKSNVPEGRWRAAKKGKTAKNPLGENQEWWEENGPTFARNWAEFLITQDDWELYYTPDGRPGIELFTQFLVSGTAVKAIPDRVYRKKSTGKLVIVDLKSGGNRPSAGWQLPIYQLAMEVVFGEEVEECFYFMNRKSELLPDYSPVVYDRGLMEEMFTAAIRLAESGPYWPTPEPSKCRWCDVRPACKFATRRVV